MGFLNYLQSTKAELRQVKWPTRVQTGVFTALVIVFSVGLAAILGAFDLLFHWLIQFFI
jgi:preprotein translocase SecE subunit